MTYGASREAWEKYASLGLTADLLPVVSNPNATISERSTMQGLGKTPSVYNRDRCAIGMSQWTSFIATKDDISEWRREPDYGICIQTRTIRALDIDIRDPELAQAVATLAQETLGLVLPTRTRPGSGKRLLAFSCPSDEYFPKLVIPVGDEIVEILGDGRQFIAEGTHPSGGRYQWNTFDAFPRISLDEFAKMVHALEMTFATGPTIVSRERRRAAGDAATGSSDDPRADWLLKNWEVWDAGDDDVLYLRCPFEHEHTSQSGPTSTAYFPAGTGGYEKGHWRCLHAHCEGREDSEFDEKCGYAISGFIEVIEELAKTPAAVRSNAYDPNGGWPKLLRTPTGGLVNNITNMVACVSHGGITGVHVVWDEFRDELMRADGDRSPEGAQWEPFTDADYTIIRLGLEKRGMKGPGIEMVRDAVRMTAHINRMDSAIEWLGRLQWDGVSRVTEFAERYLQVPPSRYGRAVGQYLWTAMAGRVLSPGCQADMVPVWIGAQGARKTSLIKAMVPDMQHYLTINLLAKDVDLSRMMRGKLVGELEELRGLNSREAEEIKAWVTKTHEEWVPKFVEFGKTFARRLVFIGTGNDPRFLADGTGERRWLPMMVGQLGQLVPEHVMRDREQLWAEAALLFKMGGVSWQEAEELAVHEHDEFRVYDVWSDFVEDWMTSEDITKRKPLERGFTVAEALNCVGLRVGSVTQWHANRMERILMVMGLRRTGNIWHA
jgi:hypothetical protein